MHWEGHSRLRRLNMQRRVMQLDIGAEEIRERFGQPWIGYGMAPRGRVEMQIVQVGQHRTLLYVWRHIDLSPRAGPAHICRRPVLNQLVQLSAQGFYLRW